jgi:sulfhydrogenase subunit gamma (sulfur reductase)
MNECQLDRPVTARVQARIQESGSIFTLRLALPTDFAFVPGQFNELYLPGVGAVPISIVRAEGRLVDHSIRAVGRTTLALSALKAGDSLLLRGPFGQGWPLTALTGKNLMILTGGLGCAPVHALILELLARRGDFGRISLIQGVRHADDLIWRQTYEAWSSRGDVEVHLAADNSSPDWPWHHGRVTTLIDLTGLPQADTRVILCGPEVMMDHAIRHLLDTGYRAGHIWLSMERNMHCASGQCGHCQMGPLFVCKDGPVFNLPAIQPYLFREGI